MFRKTLRQLFLAIFIALASLPLIVAAQDNGGNPPPNGNPDDPIVDLPNNNNSGNSALPDDAFVPIPTVPPAPTMPPNYNPAENTPGEWDYPVSGIWVRTYGNTTTSGGCDDYNGDNGGMDDDYDQNDPGQQAQLCESLFGGVIMLDNQVFRADRKSSVPSWMTETYIDSYDNSSMQRILTVVSDTQVDVTTVHTSGTCTATTTIHYTFYIGGSAFGCSASLPQYIEVGGEDQPTKEEIEQEIIIDPIMGGEYSSVWLPFDSYCDADYAPKFASVTVSPTSRDDVEITVNGETYKLSGDGQRGEFNYYGENLYITLTRRLMDDFNFIWQDSNEDSSKSCYAEGVLKLAISDFTQPVFEIPLNFGGLDSDYSGSNGSEGSQTAVVPADGSYQANLKPFEGMECPADLEAQLPDFSQVELSANGNESFTFTAGDQTYQVDLLEGMWMYAEFGADNSGVIINFDNVENGYLSGTYMVMTADSQVCMVMLELSQ